MARRSLSILICILFAISTPAQETGTPLPIDSRVRIGTLDNGMRYYVRSKNIPAGRATIRLVVRAGRLAQEPDELHAAHFVEHMGFADTEHFPHRSLFPYLESIGLIQGADTQGTTKVESTEYELEIPVRPGTIDTTLLILEGWVSGVQFDPVEVEKERGIIQEEVRRRNADATNRFNTEAYIALLEGSRYAVVEQPGLAVLDTLSAESLRRFYETWYRPDLMAVIAVGDFDAASMEQEIRSRFGAVPSVVDGRPIPVALVPDHEEPILTIFTDPELSFEAIWTRNKRDRFVVRTHGDYKQAVAERMADGILVERLQGIGSGGDPPFHGVSIGTNQSIVSVEYRSVCVTPAEGGLGASFEALETELERIRRFGFTETELERQQLRYLSGVESAFNERDRTPLEVPVNQYIANFVFGDPMFSEEFDRNQSLQVVPAITLDEVNEAFRALYRKQSRQIAVGSSGRDGLVVPTETELRAILERVRLAELEPFVDTVSDGPLIQTVPTPGEVVKENEISEIGAHEWVLENGARVILVPTDFASDEILFTAQSRGGHSLVEDADYPSAVLAGQILGGSGLGAFSSTDLQKKLAGQSVSLLPFVAELGEGMEGFAAPRDIETLFQLVYLSFTAPRRDELRFARVLQQHRATIKNRAGNPAQSLIDTLDATLQQNHPRAGVIFASPFTIPRSDELLDQVTLDRVMEIYTDRFADAGDFTFFFVGNLDLDQMRLLSRTYLATLPSTGRQESWQDLGIRSPTGRVEKIVRRGQETFSQTEIAFTGSFEWTLGRSTEMAGLAQLLNLRVFARLREDLGAVYAANAKGATAAIPEGRYFTSITFDSDPEDADRLAVAALEQAEFLRTFGPSPEEIAVLNQQAGFLLQSLLQSNEFLIGQLAALDFAGTDLRDFATLPQLTAGITAESMKEAAQIFLNPENVVKVVLVPENFGVQDVDFNGDGKVDFSDFLLFATAFGSTDEAFDLDGSGEVDFADFVAFSGAFGRQLGS